MLPINPDKTNRLVRFRFKCLVEDELAHKMVLMVKGAGGAKSCCCCQNICKPGSRFLPDATGFCVPYTCLDRKRHVPQQDYLLTAMLSDLDKVAAEKPQELNDLQIEYGLVHAPRGLLKRMQAVMPTFSFLDIFMWDWFHCCLQGGTIDSEVKAMFEVFAEPVHNITVGMFDEFLQLWEWPRSYASGKTLANKGRINGSGSEFMSALPVLGIFIQDHIVISTARLQLVVESMLMAIHVCALLQNCQSTLIVTASQLEAAIMRHLTCQEEAYGDYLQIPKTHFTTHLGDMLAWFGMLIATYTQERRHQAVKNFVNARHNSSTIDTGCLEDLTLLHLKSLIDEPLQRGSLLDAHDAPLKMKDALVAAGHACATSVLLTSTKMTAYGRGVCKGDVVLVKTDVGASGFTCGRVLFLVAIDNILWAALEMWEVLQRSKTTLRCMPSPSSSFLVDASFILDACIHTLVSHGTICTVLIPARVHLQIP